MYVMPGGFDSDDPMSQTRPALPPMLCGKVSGSLLIWDIDSGRSVDRLYRYPHGLLPEKGGDGFRVWLSL